MGLKIRHAKHWIVSTASKKTQVQHRSHLRYSPPTPYQEGICIQSGAAILSCAKPNDQLPIWGWFIPTIKLVTGGWFTASGYPMKNGPGPGRRTLWCPFHQGLTQPRQPVSVMWNSFNLQNMSPLVQILYVQILYDSISPNMTQWKTLHFDHHFPYTCATKKWPWIGGKSLEKNSGANSTSCHWDSLVCDLVPGALFELSWTRWKIHLWLDLWWGY